MNDRELEEQLAEYEAGVADVLEAYEHAERAYFQAVSATADDTMIVSANRTTLIQ